MGTTISEWKDNFWSRTQTKAIQGICAIVIVFHHMAQKVSAPWLPREYFSHGLEPFLYVGFLMVGVFFFCSGYGLYTSVKSKTDYLKNFLGSHIRPVILIFLIANSVFYLVGNVFSGYNWYIYALLYLYVAFWISFRFIKKDGTAIAAIIGFVALYIAGCEFFAAGTWCYNSIIAFPVGMLVAKNNDRTADFLKKKYLLKLCALFALTVAALVSAEVLNARTGAAEAEDTYNLMRYASVILWSVSATSFSLFLFAGSMKIQIKGRVWSFLGSITLELYMIHVVFVEMFGYCFSSPENGSVCYIGSVILYVPVVLVLSIASAYALSFVRKGAHILTEKYSEIFTVMRRDAKKVLIGILIAVAAVTVILTVSRIVGRPELKKAADEYEAQNITVLKADESDIGVYIAGEGDKAVMILRGRYEASCATVSRKSLADELAKDYRVVVVDLPGTGFSTDARSVRNTENICRELHCVAEELGMKNFALLAEDISAPYAMYYVNSYPGEVSVVATIDAETAGLGRKDLELNNLSVYEFSRQNKTSARLYRIAAAIENVFGYESLIWPIYRDVYVTAVGYQKEDAARYKYFDRLASKDLADERGAIVDNLLATENMRYPSDVAVIDFISFEKRKEHEDQGIAVSEYLDALCGEGTEHRICELSDCMYCVFYKPSVYRENLLEFWKD